MNTAGTYPGQDLGLPRTGRGSVAPMGVRVGAWVIDAVLSAAIAWAFITRPALPENWSLAVWAVLTTVFVGLFGFTPGQAAVGIRVATVGRQSGLVGPWALPRTVLIAVIIPVFVVNQDGRGLHDRWCRTVVVRSR